jgi:molybdopterin-guanine dinucleotide biosynthesis protein A
VSLVGGDQNALARIAPGRPFVADRWPGEGPAGAVVTALQAVAGNPISAVVVVACDLPDLTVDAVVSVIGRGESPDRLRVADSGRLEPLLACWPLTLRTRVEAAFASGERALHDIIATLDPLLVPVAATAVGNINDPDDLRNRAERSTG